MMPCSRLGEKWRSEARALLEHVLSCKFSRLGSVARQGMEALSPSRLRMLDTIDFLKGLSGSARKKNAVELCSEPLLRKAVEELRNSAHSPNRIFKTFHIEFYIHVCSRLNFNGPVKHLNLLSGDLISEKCLLVSQTAERCVIPTGEHVSIDKSCTSLYADSYRENPSPNKIVGKTKRNRFSEAPV